MSPARTLSTTRARPRVMQDPGDLALLGTVLELQHDMPGGHARHHAWTVRDAPKLLWSPKRQALYLFPGLKLPRPKALRMPQAAAARSTDDALASWRTWTGRTPAHSRSLQLPAPQIQTAGQGHHIVYRSDKWGPVTDYIHHFAAGTTVDLAACPQPNHPGVGHEGEAPAVLIVRGPPLRLTARGLVD